MGIGNASGFDIGMGIVGGIIIAIATSINLFCNHRATNISAMFHGLVSLKRDRFHTRISGIMGILIASTIMWNFYGFSPFEKRYSFFDHPRFMVSQLSYLGFAFSGFFIGFGTRMAGGGISGVIF